MPAIESLDDLDAEPHAVPFDGEPKTVRLSLAEGESVAGHSHPGRTIVCYVVSGRLDLRLGDETYELDAGDLARFDGDQEISPRAAWDTEAVLVLAPTGD